MGRNQAKPSFDRKERVPVSKKDLTDALKQVLLADHPEGQHSANRTPTNEELQERYKLERR
jgi:hypothetical protein